MLTAPGSTFRVQPGAPCRVKSLTPCQCGTPELHLRIGANTPQLGLGSQLNAAAAGAVLGGQEDRTGWGGLVHQPGERVGVQCGC